MLTPRQKQELRADYFLRYEIDQLDKAKTNQYSSVSQEFDINSVEFRRMRASRKRRVRELKKQGLNNQQIGSYLFNYYRGKKDNSIMDLLQFDYYKTRRRTTRADFDKKKRRIHQKLGKSYGGSKPYG